jgi:hypothetical protein
VVLVLLVCVWYGDGVELNGIECIGLNRSDVDFDE